MEWGFGFVFLPKRSSFPFSNVRRSDAARAAAQVVVKANRQGVRVIEFRIKGNLWPVVLKATGARPELCIAVCRVWDLQSRGKICVKKVFGLMIFRHRALLSQRRAR